MSDWEHISEEEQRIWRDDDAGFDLSGESEGEEEDSQDSQETFQAHLTHEVVIYKINKPNCVKKQIESDQQTLKAFWIKNLYKMFV